MNPSKMLSRQHLTVKCAQYVLKKHNDDEKKKRNRRRADEKVRVRNGIERENSKVVIGRGGTIKYKR